MWLHPRSSLISNPASSIATVTRWNVRVPPKASRCPPGFSTRSTSAHMATSKAIPDESQPLPMNASSYGGSVTTASTDASGMAASTSRQSP